MEKLKEAREKINKIDRELARLFCERMDASRAVAEWKGERGLPIEDSTREVEVLRRGAEAVENDTYREYFTLLQKCCMTLSKAYQSRLLQGMRVAYCGTEGAYAHIASEKLFASARKVAYPTFEEAYRAVEDGECDAVVLPLENSYNGEVSRVTDLMFSGELWMSCVTDMPIAHDLLCVPGSDESDITTVVSHPQALAQCREYIKAKGYREIELENTALASKYVAEKGDKSLAAIASSEAGKIFGLDVLASNINSSRSNTTRFGVFVRTRHVAEGDQQVSTALMFTVRHTAGALAKAIDIVGKYGYNLAALRSRPMKELLWQYYFYLEAEGNMDTENGRQMQEELRLYCDRLKIAGIFKRV